jgi:hypothetical protein
MNLNLGNDYFGAGNNFDYTMGQDTPNVMATQEKAVLYVFKPFANQFGDVGLRPFQYIFDENFTQTAQEISDMSKRGVADAPSIVSQLMAHNNLSDHLMPTMESRMVMRSSRLNDAYRFILILSENSRDLAGGNTLAATSPNAQIRRIYNGFFQDEPFNFQTFSTSGHTLNPNAMMATVQHGRFGAENFLNTQTSEEIFQPQIAKNLLGHLGGRRDDSFFMMTPENCVNSYESAGPGHHMYMPGTADLSREQGASVVADVLEQPAHNVSHIMRGMIRFQDEVSHRSRLNMNNVDNYYADEFLEESIGRGKISRYLQIGRSKPQTSLDLDVDTNISAQDLDNLVGNRLHVVPFDIARPIYYETADQMEISVTNQYSFLIASVIAPLLNAAGLASMSFMYQVATRQGQVVEDFKTNAAEPSCIIPTETTLKIVKAVEVELRNGIFSTIFGSKGDFHVLVNANTTGNTTVRLTLVGQGYRNPVNFEVPTCMGGLISPLLGDSMSHAHNSEQIEMLYNVATGSNGNSNNNHVPQNDFLGFSGDKDDGFKDFADGGTWQTSRPYNEEMTID